MTTEQITVYLDKGERIAQAMHDAARTATENHDYPRASHLFERIANLYAHLDDLAEMYGIDR